MPAGDFTLLSELLQGDGCRRHGDGTTHDPRRRREGDPSGFQPFRWNLVLPLSAGGRDAWESTRGSLPGNNPCLPAQSRLDPWSPADAVRGPVCGSSCKLLYRGISAGQLESPAGIER
ncbi:hypothetical protein FHT76_008052 [Rhizobium sp. BK176]|nr:hypothetical protein [Rhizobium sp. BK176]